MVLFALKAWDKTYITWKWLSFALMFILKGFIYVLERGREGNINMWLPFERPLLGTWPATQACALIWESNFWLFGSQAGAQSTEPHQSGLPLCLNKFGD